MNRFFLRTAKSAFLVTLSAIIVLGCARSNIKPEKPANTPEKKLAPIESYMKILSAGDPAEAPDGKLYYTTWTSGVDRLYCKNGKNTIEVSPPEEFPEGIDYYSLSPSGRFIAIGADIAGDEQYDIYLYDTNISKATFKLIDGGRNVRTDSIVWAPSSDSFYYRSTRRNGKDFDIWRYRIGEQAPELFMQREGYIWLYDISPDGNRMASVRYRGGHLSDLDLIDIDTKSIRRLSGDDRESGSYSSVHFLADGKSLLFVSDDGYERPSIGLMDTGKPGWRKLVDLPWNIEALALSPDRKTAAYLYNEHGYSRMVLANAETLETIFESTKRKGLIRSLSFGSNALLYAYAGPAETQDIWRIEIDTGKTVRETFSDYAGVDISRFVEPELVFYPSFDGLEIPAFLYRPKGYGKRPAPFVIYAHGGPESQFRPGFIRNFQYLLERGIGVLAPNVRGSSGYTQKYLALDNYKKRMDSIKDFKAAADWLTSEGLADNDRIAISGGSYGGFVALSATTEYPERFAAAVCSVGVVNFVSYFKNTRSYRKDVRTREYGPLDDVEFLESISPINKIDMLKTPLLIVHGENDPRVPVDEARQVVKAMNDRGRTVEALIFPDEGHGIKKLENRLLFYRRMADFLIRHLDPDPDRN